MRCCPECFGDQGLSGLIRELSDARGKCSYCKADNQPLLEPGALAEYFGPLLGVYRQVDAGRSILAYLKEDWALFRNPNLGRLAAEKLLADISDDGDLVRAAYLPRSPKNTRLSDQWKLLVAELTHVNRFFPQNEFEFDTLSALFSHLELNSKPEEVWFRARIERDGKRYDASQMGAPPKRVATHGRANPAGIPYLYLGSDVETAVSEIRPHTGEVVCVAKFTIDDTLKFLDLRKVRTLISPFLLGDETALASLQAGDIDFLEFLERGLTVPVLPSSAAIDYTATQYLCEFIKKCGYAGVVYSSSVGPGHSLALFDPNLARAGRIDEYSIDEVSVALSKK